MVFTLLPVNGRVSSRVDLGKRDPNGVDLVKLSPDPVDLGWNSLDVLLSIEVFLMPEGYRHDIQHANQRPDGTCGAGATCGTSSVFGSPKSPHGTAVLADELGWLAGSM